MATPIYDQWGNIADWDYGDVQGTPPQEGDYNSHPPPAPTAPDWDSMRRPPPNDPPPGYQWEEIPPSGNSGWGWRLVPTGGGGDSGTTNPPNELGGPDMNYQHPPNFISEADGRRGDAEKGLIGGYMTEWGWVSGSPSGGGGGGGGGGYSGGGGWGGGGNPYYDAGAPPGLNLPRFQAPPDFKFGGKSPNKFVAPTHEEAQNEPGYQFRLEQGKKALEQSAAGKGVLRTGGTLKDLIGYGQNFASAEYGNVYNRRAGEHDRDFREYLSAYDLEADTYSKNYGVKRDVFDRDYQAQLAEYQPKLVGWQQNANAKQREAELLFGNEWDEYVFNENTRLQRERDAYQKEQDRLNRLERQSQPRT